MRTRTIVGLALAAGATVLGAAFAQTATPLPAAVQRLLDCRATQSDLARLACYDAAIGEFGRLLSAGELVVVDHERVTKVKRQAFGFNLPTLGVFEHDGKPAELKEVTGTVAQAHRRAGRGPWVIELDDGAVWEQTDDEKLAREPRKGSKVSVRKAALGSFFMNIDGQAALRVQRVR